MNDLQALTSIHLGLYRTEQIKALERCAMTTLKLDEDELMERAGAFAFLELKKIYPYARKILVCCGSGNNGGDGYVLARLAHLAGLSVVLYAATVPKHLPKPAATAYFKAKDAGLKLKTELPDNLCDFDLLVDALLGLGLKDKVREPLASLIHTLNDSRLPILALDLPSGLNADSGELSNVCIKASHTLSFLAQKPGCYTLMGPEVCGEIHYNSLQTEVCFNSIEPQAWLLNEVSVRFVLPKRLKNVHKGDFGHVLVIGGGSGMAGAAALAAKAALRTGAGLVTVATRPLHIAAILPFCPEAMVVGVEQADELDKLLKAATVVVLGPGLGESPWAIALFNRALNTKVPMVIDASALRLLAEVELSREAKPWILTPHPGEAAALLKTNSLAIQKNRFEAVKLLQEKYQSLVLLKGAGSLLCSEKGVSYLCQSGNPGMASAGMGDVLSGIIAGFLAQCPSLLPAAKAAVWLHGHIADVLSEAQGQRGLLASDLINEIPLYVNGLKK